MQSSADLPRAASSGGPEGDLLTTEPRAPRALAHPIPAGMRDLLPEETRRRRALTRLVLEHFALHGYQLVTPPAFEFAEVLERGLGTLDPSDVLRFIEPESGEVAALRPDMTPQIARMVATRLASEPWPIRLCYEGTTLRRRQGRARRHRQIPQAGVELYGALDRAGDLEILHLAAVVLSALGLEDVVIDLGHASIARSLLDPLPTGLANEVGDALAQKDGARVERLLGNSPTARATARLVDLHGGGPGEPSGEAMLATAEPLFAATKAAGPLRELRALWEACKTVPGNLSQVLRLDLGEVRGFAYYTGAIFHMLAPGPGEPIGAGGRYDDLLARFDTPMPAVGFALYLDSVAWARDAAKVSDGRPKSAVVASRRDLDPAPVLAALRALGVTAVAHPEDVALAYAEAWRFSHLVTVMDGTPKYRAVAVGAPVHATLNADDPGALARAITQQF